MDIGSLLGIGANVLSGGIVGAVGALIGKGLDIWHHKQEIDGEIAILKVKNDHDLALQDKAALLMKLEAESKLQVAQTEAASADSIAQYASMQTSIMADKRLTPEGTQSRWFIFVDVLRGLTRPVLTLYLDIVATVIAYDVYILLQGIKGLDPTVLNALFIDLVNGLMFMASTATMWWFAARGVQPRSGKNGT